MVLFSVAQRAERERADNDIRDESDRRLTESKRTEALLKELIERLQRDMSLVKCAFDQARQEFDAERQILVRETVARFPAEA